MGEGENETGDSENETVDDENETGDRDGFRTPSPDLDNHPQGASRAIGGLFRGRAMGNQLNMGDMGK
jgi:hypothetical protein